MAQDSTKLVMGSTLSSVMESECFNVDPANFPAGVCVSMASTGLPSLLKSAGFRMGVSLGKSQSDHKKTSICRTGLKVPVLASLKRSTGVITITNYANLVSGTDDVITVGATAFTAQAGAATLGDPTFRAATDNATTATSLATQINAHAVASTKVYAVASSATVTLYSVVEGAGTGHDVALSYTDNDTNIGATVSGAALTGGSNTISAANLAYAVDGAKMYINDTTGKADIAITGFTTVSDAVYRNAWSNGTDSNPVFTGIAEDGSEVAAVLVDMQGSL